MLFSSVEKDFARRLIFAIKSSVQKETDGTREEFCLLGIARGSPVPFGVALAKLQEERGKCACPASRAFRPSGWLLRRRMSLRMTSVLHTISTALVMRLQ